MKTERKGFKQMVDEAKSRIKTISLEEAKGRLGSDQVVSVLANPAIPLDQRSVATAGLLEHTAVSYTHLTLPTTPYV